MIKTLLRLLFILQISAIAQAFAAEKLVEEKNYFASLRGAETNVRAGPGQHYPIKFTFKSRGVPVRVISEYDNWNEIEDYEGQSGWVSQSLLTKKRTILVRTNKEYIDLHSKNNEKSRILYHLENNVIGQYLKCVEDWCAIEVNDKKGWVKKNEIYGDEDLKTLEIQDQQLGQTGAQNQVDSGVNAKNEVN